MDKFKLSIIACLTLGLAPFFPEPHIWGKLKWLAGGAEGMAFADYFDILLHGTPWGYFIYQLFLKFKANKD
ncbi:MAG: hypothetical protein ACJATA_001561 [Sphingobacteriales bacterium]|jgi:hypothetical protein